MTTGAKLGIYDRETLRLKRTIDLVPDNEDHWSTHTLAEPYTASADELTFLFMPTPEGPRLSLFPASSPLAQQYP